MDIVGNGIWGKVKAHLQSENGSLFTQYMNVHQDEESPKPDWAWWTPKDGQLATQWRTTPCTLDWNKDGLNVRTDKEGFVWFKDMGPMDILRFAGHTTSPLPRRLG